MLYRRLSFMNKILSEKRLQSHNGGQSKHTSRGIELKGTLVAARKAEEKEDFPTHKSN